MGALIGARPPLISFLTSTEGHWTACMSMHSAHLQTVVRKHFFMIQDCNQQGHRVAAQLAGASATGAACAGAATAPAAAKRSTSGGRSARRSGLRCMLSNASQSCSSEAWWRSQGCWRTCVQGSTCRPQLVQPAPPLLPIVHMLKIKIIIPGARQAQARRAATAAGRVHRRPCP